MNRYSPQRISEDDNEQLVCIRQSIELTQNIIETNINPLSTLELYLLLRKEQYEYYELVNRVLHEAWQDAYQLYAADHNLIVGEHDIINICNRHRVWQIINSGQVVQCDCRSGIEGAEHSYAFGSNTCDYNTRTVIRFPEVMYIGFIGYPDPVYFLKHDA
jgi:hypothetical protein